MGRRLGGWRLGGKGDGRRLGEEGGWVRKDVG